MRVLLLDDAFFFSPFTFLIFLIFLFLFFVLSNSRFSNFSISDFFFVKFFSAALHASSALPFFSFFFLFSGPKDRLDLLISK